MNGNTASLQPVFSEPNARTWHEAVVGERVCVLVYGSEVEGRFSILESIAAPGTATPMHTHREEEVFQVQEGVLTICCDGRTIDARAGSIVVVPSGAPHGWRNRGDVPVRMVVTFLPGGLEDMLTGLERLKPEDVPPFAACFGTYIVGPPIPA